MTTLAEFLNQLEHNALTDNLHKCCAAESWVDGMKSQAPFRNDAEIEAAATRIWWELDRDAWLQAFAAHPRIGDVSSLRAKFSNTQQWASGEQSGADDADDQTIHQLAELNGQYFEKFGFIFIICATGKTAREMLDALEQRLPNKPQTELQIAASEQIKITILRLRKLTT